MHTLLMKNLSAFKPKKVNLQRVADIHIEICSDAKPVQRKAKIFSPDDTAFLNAEAKRLLELGVIRRSHSLYSCNPSIALKASGERRLTTNLMPVNPQLSTPPYPAVYPETIYQRALGRRFMSVLDLKDAFW